MAKVKLIGYKDVNFTPKGESAIVGTKLFVAYNEDGVIGQKTEDLFIRDPEKIGIDLKAFVGKEINIDFGFKGKVDYISAV